jgi:predicted dehydrogenase
VFSVTAGITDLRAVIVAQERTGTVIVVGQTSRFQASLTRWRNRLASGDDALGALRAPRS